MRMDRGRRGSGMSRRKLIAYALSVAIFAGAMLLAIRLSFPPDPRAGRHSGRSTDVPTLQVDGNQHELTVGTEEGQRRYRFYRSKDGLVAREVTGREDEEQNP